MRLQPNDIPSRSQSCVIKGELFVPGMEYFSELLEDPNGKWLRKDYCVSCWQKKESGEIYWKSSVPTHAKKPQENPEIHAEMIQALKELIEAKQEEEKAFMLALFLARKRKLALRKEMEENGKTLQLYEILETEEMVPVVFVPLSEIKTEEIKAYFKKKFGVKS